jgi:hypothetical protein
LMQGVVNRRERHAEARDIGLGVQILRRNVAMPSGEEDAAQLDPLTEATTLSMSFGSITILGIVGALS